MAAQKPRPGYAAAGVINAVLLDNPQTWRQHGDDAYFEYGRHQHQQSHPLS